MIVNCALKYTKEAELAELVDALDSGSSVRKDFRVQVPGSAYQFWIWILDCSPI